MRGAQRCIADQATRHQQLIQTFTQICRLGQVSCQSADLGESQDLLLMSDGLVNYTPLCTSQRWLHAHHLKVVV